MDKDAAGFPIGKIYFAAGIGLNGVFNVAFPSSKGLYSNFYAANYFDIATT